MADSKLKLNFSSEEASSEAMDFDPIPTGKYWVKITEVEDRECGPQSKNPGKPYWNVELTVQDGDYELRKLWANVMLFEGALYSLSQLVKALGYDVNNSKGFTVPDGEELVGKDLIVSVRKQLDVYKMEQEASEDNIYKNEVKGFKPYSPEAVGGSKDGSLLP